jgi:hypothetical protein
MPDGIAPVDLSDERQDRFYRPLVKTNDLVRPETPSIDRCSLESAFAPAISDR